MIRALYTAASGMSAQQLNLDTIANNLANSSTTGFRQLRLEFQDMVYQNLVTPGAAQSQTTVSAGLQIGLGTKSAATGVALIWVDAQGQNSIVVASGANHAFVAADVAGLRRTVRGAAFLLAQLETPLDTVSALLALAREEGARTILDPAPARPLSRDLLGAVDILTPNESEALILLGRPPARVSTADAPALAAALRGLGANAVVLKLGDQGSLYDDGERPLYEPAFAVEVTDSTAAGDTFNGALAVALAEQMPMSGALRFASAAAAISVTRDGAQSSMPTRAEVESFLLSTPGAA